MKDGVRNASLLVGRIDGRTMRLLWLLLSLMLFVLGAGAPGTDGGHAG